MARRLLSLEPLIPKLRCTITLPPTSCRVIARPSLIDGDRAALGQAGRVGEGLGLKLARGLGPLLPSNYRAIKASDIAHALIHHVKAGVPGVVTLMSGEMQGGG